MKRIDLEKLPLDLLAFVFIMIPAIASGFVFAFRYVIGLELARNIFEYTWCYITFVVVVSTIVATIKK